MTKGTAWIYFLWCTKKLVSVLIVMFDFLSTTNLCFFINNNIDYFKIHIVNQEQYCQLYQPFILCAQKIKSVIYCMGRWTHYRKQIQCNWRSFSQVGSYYSPMSIDMKVLSRNLKKRRNMFKTKVCSEIS